MADTLQQLIIAGAVTSAFGLVVEGIKWLVGRVARSMGEASRLKGKLPTRKQAGSLFASRATVFFWGRVFLYILLVVKCIPGQDDSPATARDVAEIGLICSILLTLTIDNQFYLHVDLPLTLKHIGPDHKAKT